jgi:hypothetical protein
MCKRDVNACTSAVISPASMHGGCGSSQTILTVNYTKDRELSRVNSYKHHAVRQYKATVMITTLYLFPNRPEKSSPRKPLLFFWKRSIKPCRQHNAAAVDTAVQQQFGSSAAGACH